MANKQSTCIDLLVKELIGKLTPLKDDSKEFKASFEHFQSTLHRQQSMCVVVKKEIDDCVDGLAEKLNFHAFLHEADALKDHYLKFIGQSPGEEEMNVKLSVMKLLFELSRSPTRYLSSLGADDQQRPCCSKDAGGAVEVFDWGAYLKEGIEPWQLPPDDSSDEWSEDDQVADNQVKGDDQVEDDDFGSVENFLKKLESTLAADDQQNLNTDDGSSDGDVSEEMESPALEADDRLDLNSDHGPWATNSMIIAADGMRECREYLRQHVQHSWWKQDFYRELPSSSHPEATVALRWEEYLAEASGGLCAAKSSIISEYKVCREVIWQMYGLHNSFVFRLEDDKITVKDNVTICSARPFVFKHFMGVFLKDMEMLHELRLFVKGVIDDWDNSPDSYKGYANGLNDILIEFTKDLSVYEMEVMKQEKPVTLIGVSHKLKLMMKDFHYLYNYIHKICVLDYKKKPAINCVTRLLSGLHFSVGTAITQSTLHLSMALYVESLCCYISTIDLWFRKLKLLDDKEEFPVYWCNPRSLYETACDREDAGLDEEAEWEATTYNHIRPYGNQPKNPIIDYIRETLGDLSRHIHLLFLLKRGYLLSDEWSSQDRLFDEFFREVLKRTGEVCGTTPDLSNIETEEDDEEDEGPFVTGVFKFKGSKYYTEMDKLENLVNTDNEFLMAAFGNYWEKWNKSKKFTPMLNTFEQLRPLVTRNVPVRFVVVESFGQVFENRYKNCREVLLNVLKTEYKIWDHFEFYQRVYLFKNDETFPFYYRFFDYFQYEKYPICYLITELQDCFRESHPDLWRRVSVQGPEDFYIKGQEVANYCLQIKIDYEPQWPFKIFMKPLQQKMYEELFNFILTIKWCLHVLVELKFTPMMHKGRKNPLLVQVLFGKFYKLRFGLLNLFSSMQHYIFAFLYTKCLAKFCREYESATNYEDLVESHSEFIYQFHRSASQLRDYKFDSPYSFTTALYLLNKLWQMWNEPGRVDLDALDRHLHLLTKCQEHLFEALDELMYLSTMD